VIALLLLLQKNAILIHNCVGYPKHFIINKFKETKNKN